MKNVSENTVLTRGGLAVTLLATGDVRSIEADGVLYNAYLASATSGAIGAIYLRRYSGDRVAQAVRLTGYRSPSEFGADKTGAIYTGRAAGAKYTVRLAVTADSWFYRVEVAGPDRYDLVYTFDTGVGDTAFVRRNELYASQYLGHTVFQTDYGATVASRQNMAQRGRNPALLQGSIGLLSIRYCTDGLQWFGPRFRLTDTPACLYTDLPNRVLQYEMGFVGLQTTPFDRTAQCGFFGHIRPDVPDRITGPFDYAAVLDAYAALDFPSPASHTPPRSNFGTLLDCRDAADDDFPRTVILPERDGRGILSAFTPSHDHIVARRKEGVVERPHGNILLGNLDITEIPRDVTTTTGMMYGMFQGQTACGNTDFDALLSLPRGFVNLPRHSGLRITVTRDGKRQLLGVPTLFTAGLNFTRWDYALPDDTLTVETTVDGPRVQTHVASRAGVRYDWIVSLDPLLDCVQKDDVLVFTPRPDTPAMTYHPDLVYTATLDTPHTVSDDRVFFDDHKPRDGLITLSTSASNFTLTITCTSARRAPATDVYQLLQAALPADRDPELWNATLHWMTHDALVHYAAPHGLEQTGGAAWGTRDVCQGPVELFSALGRFDVVRVILCRVFAAQNGDGTFPQWFMFDRYPYAAGDSHGDVVFWPLYALGNYLSLSRDRAVLDVTLADGQTLGAHAERALSHIASRVDADGFLPYDGGDWNDTLQPCDARLRQTLTSSWTVALALQTLDRLAPYFDVGRLRKRLRRGFDRLNRDGVTAGFGRKDGRRLTLLFHPDDAETGIRYRLISLTRSILAGLVDREQAERHMRIIAEHLLCPDGARLWDAPIAYDGGVPKRFVRAETAACVGREIGLMYTHAHLRYVETLVKLGDTAAAYDALLRVNPIATDAVRNGTPRQRNCYFSSSDAAFPTRAAFDFDALRDGRVPVRGGWRVYSSGAGITVALLLRLQDK